jgi:uncharacterized protein
MADFLSVRSAGNPALDRRRSDPSAGAIYPPVVGALRLLAAWRARSAHRGNSNDDDVKPAPLAVCVLAGAVIGFIAGITGIGGGILLAPAILAREWTSVRETVAVSAAFNLLNSVAALAGL